MARTAAPRTDLSLIGVGGDVEAGERFALDAEAPTLIGRSSKGIRLMDPLVSVRHAEIMYDPYRGYVIKDLGSVTGTWVDDECLKGEERPIGIGTRLRFGETEFRVEVRRRIPRWFRWVALFLVGMAGLGLLAFIVQGMGPPSVPELYWQKGIGLPNGEVDSVAPDPRWLRKRGLFTSDLRLRGVSDHDHDGISELWMDSSGHDQVFIATYGEDGSWQSLGDVPRGCIEQSLGLDEFPLLECEGELWMIGDSGRYELLKSEGAVVWYKATPNPEDRPERDPDEGPLGGGAAALIDVPIDVARVVLKNPEKVSKFLAMRNVTEPIHYLICEDAFEGIGAQALTASGQVVPLAVGCIHELRLEGLIQGDPVAMALTGAGRQAMIDDVTRFYGGNPDGLFLRDPERKVVERMSVAPGVLRGGTKVVGETHQDSPLPFYNPIAPEPNGPLGSHELDPIDRRTKASPLARTANLLEAGEASLESLTTDSQGEGCVELRAEVSKYRCHGLCTFLPNSTFLELYDVGCGERRLLLSTGFTGGIYEAAVGGIQVRALVESRLGGKGADVVRVRVSAREATGN